MRKIDYDFLVNGFHNPLKDQVLLHAMSELKGIPYTPVMEGISARLISTKAQVLYSACGCYKPVVGDFGSCSEDMGSVARLLINRGDFSKIEIENKIAILMETVYNDTAYIECMGPFF